MAPRPRHPGSYGRGILKNRETPVLKDTLGVMQFGIIPPIEFALRLTWSSDEKNKKD